MVNEYDSQPPACLLITGTVGAGKTSTAYAVGEELRRQGVPHAVIDLDELCRGWPSPPEDPFNSILGFTNLRSVSQNYLLAGARRLIMAGVVEGTEGVEEHTAAVGMSVTVCRLRVDLNLVRQRLVARHDPGPSLEWHLHRSGELDGVLDRQLMPDAILDVGDDSLESVALRVLTAIGWESSPAVALRRPAPG
ncbi:MAG: hypothetical protein Q4P15_00590 [Propionibacteriaceae bacterium]|nr:hypothetical protein [Propionibacteriaceae bacterium]